jgi:hypothetical protein
MRCMSVVLLSLLLWAQPAAAQVEDIRLKDGNICRGGSIDLRELIDVHPSYVPYSRWKQGNTYLNASGFSHSVSPTATTTYTLEYRLSENGETLTKDAQVIVWQEPNVTIPADTSVCRGQKVTLHATAANAQDVIWRSGTATYSNGTEVRVESHAHSFVVTARNYYCPSISSATWSVEGQPPIVAADAGAASQNPVLCRGATIDLNSLLRFSVRDDEGNAYPATLLSVATTWTSNGTPVADAANYTVPVWANLIASVTATVAYTSLCSGAQTYTVNRVSQPVILTITGGSSTLSASCEYRDCPGDPVDIDINLNTHCFDSIKHVNITYAGGSADCNLNLNTPTRHTYRCKTIPYGAKYTAYVETTAIATTMEIAPLPVPPPAVAWPDDICMGDSADFCITTTCDDIETVAWEVTPASAGTPQYVSHSAQTWCYRLTATENATYTAKIWYRRKGDNAVVDTTMERELTLRPSAFRIWASPDTICKGDSAYVVVTSDCDSIVRVEAWNINPEPVPAGRSKTMMAFRTTVAADRKISARVVYYNRSTKSNASIVVEAWLYVHNKPPEVSPATYDLCRGSAGTATVVANDCDTIKNVLWKDKLSGAVLSPQPLLNPDFPPTPTQWQYILSPGDSITYTVEIEYMRSSETVTRTANADVVVNVRERPHILIAPRVPVCSQTGTLGAFKMCGRSRTFTTTSALAVRVAVSDERMYSISTV